MQTDALAPEAKAKFAKTVAAIDAGELYVPCPRCRGERMISVCTDPGSDFRPSQWEYVGCPCCHSTGEADAENAMEHIETWQEREGLDA